jgi:DNA-binding MarR family transcriptional regulator
VELQLRESHNLLLSWFEPMQVIERTDDCRVANIVIELSISVGGASKLVDRIEAAGFCRRRSDSGDGRSSIIELTSAGRKILAHAGKTFVNTLDTKIGSTISEDALAQFTETIRQFRTGLKVSAGICKSRKKK